MDQGPPSLENRIYGFIVEQSAFSRKKLSPNARLAQDIGMDGDDAVEFFEKFGKRFSVDLERLYVYWDLHFAPEGGALPLRAIVVMTCCGVCGFVLNRWLGIFPGWLWAALLAIAALWIHARWFAHRICGLRLPSMT